MWPRYTFQDFRSIAHYLGVLIAYSSLVYVPAILVGLLSQEWSEAARFLLAAGINLTVGVALLFFQIKPKRLTKMQAIAITGLAWVILALLASFPLYFSGHYLTYSDALFDGVSGFTTTGASLVQNLDHLSNADNMFRFSMILVGGLGLVVVALSLGLFGRSGGASLYASEGRSEHVVPNVVQTTRFITRIALGFIIAATIIMTVLCLTLGMSAPRSILHSFWLSITSFMTGGFAPMSQSVLYYHSFPLELVIMLVMLMGSISFIMHDNLWKGHLLTFFRDIETHTMLIWLFVVTVVFAATMSSHAESSQLFSMMRLGLFSIIAAFSTTGLQNVSSNQLVTTFSQGALLVLAMTMAVGASSGGTAGGMKLFRMGIVARTIIATVKETLSPNSARVIVTYQHAGKRHLTHDISRDALTVFLLFVGTYVVGTLAGIAYGYDPTQAIFESVAMASNGGITSGIVAPGMPKGLEYFYMFEMWAGRLEFITLIALIIALFVSIKPHGLRRGGQR